MAFYNLPVYSKIYMEVENEDWTAVPTSSLLQRIHQANEVSTTRWIAVLHYKGKEYHIALGDPVRDSSQALFVPSWFLHQMDVIGDGFDMEVSVIPAESFPKATRLKFSLIGDPSMIPEGVEIRDLLETPLSQLGVLSKGQRIPIPVLEHHSLLLQECDPGEEVFLDGSDIAFELEMPEQNEQPKSREDTPWASPLTQTPMSTPAFTSDTSFFSGPMISSIISPAAVSNATQSFRTSTRGTFLPFQGAGRSLNEQ
jgi:hypothetical protein